MIKIISFDENKVIKFHFENLVKNNLDKILDDINSELSEEHYKSLKSLLIKLISNKDISKNLFTANPIILKETTATIDNSINAVIKKTRIKKTEILKKIKASIKYQKYEYWQPYKISELLQVEVCPYCNRNMIGRVGDDKNPVIRCEFDHFYPRNKFPHLGLSLFNLVPCCNQCNKIKSSKLINILPYNSGYSDDIKLKIIPLEATFSEGIPESFYIDIENHSTSNKEDIENQMRILKIKEIYHSNHNSHVGRLLKLYYSFPPESIEYLYNFNEKHKIFSSRDLLISTIFGAPLNKEDIGKMPLGKLTYDILKELRGGE
jgi:hypothetical protein